MVGIPRKKASSLVWAMKPFLPYGSFLAIDCNMVFLETLNQYWSHFWTNLFGGFNKIVLHLSINFFTGLFYDNTKQSLRNQKPIHEKMPKEPLIWNSNRFPSSSHILSRYISGDSSHRLIFFKRNVTESYSNSKTSKAHETEKLRCHQTRMNKVTPLCNVS